MKKISERVADLNLPSSEDLISDGLWDYARERQLDDLMRDEMFGESAKRELAIKHARYMDLPHDNPSALDALGQY